jgi:hypothetical protein
MKLMLRLLSLSSRPSYPLFNVPSSPTCRAFRSKALHSLSRSSVKSLPSRQYIYVPYGLGVVYSHATEDAGFLESPDASVNIRSRPEACAARPWSLLPLLPAADRSFCDGTSLAAPSCQKDHRGEGAAGLRPYAVTCHVSGTLAVPPDDTDVADRLSWCMAR